MRLSLWAADVSRTESPCVGPNNNGCFQMLCLLAHLQTDLLVLCGVWPLYGRPWDSPEAVVLSAPAAREPDENRGWRHFLEWNATLTLFELNLMSFLNSCSFNFSIVLMSFFFCLCLCLMFALPDQRAKTCSPETCEQWRVLNFKNDFRKADLTFSPCCHLAC